LNCHILDLAFVPDGRLFGTDGQMLVNINTTTGEVTNQSPFTYTPVTGLAYMTPVAAGPVDVWIKDCLEDLGNAPSVPTPCAVAYKSPDIWIDNDSDMIIDAPVVGAANILRAKVRNRQVGSAQDVSVKFYYRDNTTGLYFPDGATFIGESTVSVPPNGVALASVEWTVPAPPSSGGHWCIGVLLNHADDPLPDPAPQARDHNNVAIANIWYIAERAGEQELMSFSVGTGGGSGFGLTPWPRKFVIEVDNRLPPGWNWDLEGVQAKTPFVLKLGEERKATLKIVVPKDAAAHTGGSIDVRQVDVATGMVVGGLNYNLYEDHRPPEKIQTLSASLTNGLVTLSWDKVRKEAETGLSERVAYYEILRDGKALVKALRDGDPHRPGFQWKETGPLKGSAVYTVRAVDEGGNTSEISNEARVSSDLGVTKPGKVFNWLTWLLLALTVIPLVLLVRRGRRT
jgi:hypothetical protein